MNYKWIIDKEYCKKSYDKFSDVEQEIINEMSKELEKALLEECFTSATNNVVVNEPLITEKLLKTIKDLQDSLPSFEILDMMIADGYRASDLVLMIYSEVAKEETIQTKHGALLVIGSPMFSPESAYIVPNNTYKPFKIQWD